MSHRARAILPILLLVLCSATSAGEEHERGLKSADVALQKLIDDAIERGAGWLAGKQKADGSFFSAYGVGHPMGVTALATLALLHSGHPHESKTIRRAFRRLRSLYDPGRRLTYSISLTVMALAEYGRVRGVADKGGFRLDKPDLKWLTEMVAWLVEVQSGGGWRYPGRGFDHSNSQYALLALKEARSVGIEVPEETFVKALRHFLAQQEKSGRSVPRFVEKGGDGVYAAERTRAPGNDRVRGWGYAGPGSPTGSMTAAGVAAVAICIDELKSKDTRSLLAAGRQSLRDGIAWLGEHFTVRENPGQREVWHFYYLYGLERAGVLGRVVFMGDRRWYAEGAKFLVDSQSPNGAWPVTWPGALRPPGGGNIPSDAVDQSFALLFLSRATSRALGVATEQPLLDLTKGEKLSDGEFGKLFDAAVTEYDLLDQTQAKMRARDFALMGPRVVQRLLPGLSSPDGAVRVRSVTILRSVTGLSFGFDPGAGREDREPAADQWTAWYLKSRAALRLDRSARRIR